MTPYLQDPDVTLYHGDALDVLRELPSESVHCIATSPPFYALRDYGTGRWEGGDLGHEHDRVGARGGRGGSGTLDKRSGDAMPATLPAGTCSCGAVYRDPQIGLEETPDAWAAALVAVFREARRVLRKDGTLWVECGDSYSGSNRGNAASPEAFARLQGDTTMPVGEGGTRATARLVESFASPPPGLKQKDLLGTPWLLARALRDPYYTGRITSELDRVWLAAIVDGEGCIHIHKRPAGQSAYSKHTRKDGTEAKYVRTKDSYGVMLAVANTDKSIIDRCQAITGWGSLAELAPGSHGRKQTQWRWTLTGQQSRDVLRELYPYLMGKQRQARIAIACPSNGDEAARCLEAIKALHNGRETDVDYKPPASLYEPGFYLRGAYIWSKSNAMPESAKDRCTTAHSYVFQLSKSARYFFDAEALREPLMESTLQRGYTASKFANGRGQKAEANADRGDAGEPWNVPTGSHPRSVWNIPTQGYPEAHFATFPEELVRRIILAGCPEWVCGECGKARERIVERIEQERPTSGPTRGGSSRSRVALGMTSGTGTLARPTEVVRETKGFTDCGCLTRAWEHSVACAWHEGESCTCKEGPKYVPGVILDPFVGSGTTCFVARKLGRRSVGIDLNAEYLDLAARRLQQQSLFA